jgi:hypothetical protein
MKSSRSPISERYIKTLRLGVKFNGERLELLDGTPLPKLVQGAIGELVIAPEHLVDGPALADLVREIILPFLAKDAEVYLGMSGNALQGGIPEGLIRPEELQLRAGYLMVKVGLLEDLRLHLRGDQKAWLAECKCNIPATKKEAGSLNHAFTLASTQFETSRRSHNANVFNRAWTKRGERWVRLDELRMVTIDAHLNPLKKSGASS